MSGCESISFLVPAVVTVQLGQIHVEQMSLGFVKKSYSLLFGTAVNTMFDKVFRPNFILQCIKGKYILVKCIWLWDAY